MWVTSYAKEGVFAFAGRKYDTQAALQAAKGKFTQIFVNKPVSELADGATTADASVNTMFVTDSNTGATAFTDFENAVQGKLYKIECGDTNNATTIAKAGKFSEITSAFNPSAVGDYLKVIYDPVAGKFLEYARKVGGVITLNTNLKAPEYSEA